ncbi:Uncharacterised protein [Citrobacter werkmanii]|nr:Uncharacterised protein [Citrobacter werkmanii]
MLQPFRHDGVLHGDGGADRGRAGLAFDGRLLVGIVRRTGFDRGARGGGRLSLVLSIGSAGGENQGGGGNGEEGGTHGGS